MTGFALKSDRRGWRLTSWAVLLGAAFGALLALLTASAGQRAVFDEWQRMSPRTVSGENVSVVLIDNLSLDAVGSWPWSRYYVARLTENIALQDPKVIGFDIIFAEGDARDPAAFVALYPELDAAAAQQVSELPSMDDVLGQVIGFAPVVLARAGVDGDGTDPAQLLVDPQIVGDPPAGTLQKSQVLTAIRALDDVALSHALVNGPPDDDGIVRRVPLNVIAAGTPMPGFAAELARIAAGAEQLEWRGSDLMVGDIALRADDTGSLPVKLGQFPEAHVYSAAKVIAGEVPADAFAGKVVLIGLGADGTADVVSTPLKTGTFGIFIQAQAVDAILEGGWLSRPAWAVAAEIAAAFALLILILAAVWTGRNWWLVPACILALALPVMSWAAFAGANVLLSPLMPLLVGAFAATAMWITRYALARAERARLAAELVEQRVAASEQEGELKAARRIQMGMVPGPQALAGLHRRAEIGAVLQPAKSVGGDFYDALMIGQDKLLFIVGDVTGKGVPAALFMALSKTLSKSNLSRSGDDLGAAVSALNRDLMAEADEEMGVTMLVGVLDCATGELSLINAGHENPIAVREGGDVETLAMKGGPPFCVIDFPYSAEQFALAHGDTLVVLTDGATEAQNAALELFGTEGVIASLESKRGISASDRASGLAAEVRQFEGATDPSDDLTIFALRYLPPASE